MEVYVVTEPQRGWDCIVGVFSDKEYVYSRYSSEKYHIKSLEVNDTKFVSPTPNDLKKYGRTDFVYKFFEADKIKCIGLFKTSVFENDNSVFNTFNLIDPFEGDFYIKFDGVEQKHDIDNLSVVADLFCEFTGIDKNTLMIFKEKRGEYFLGTTEEFEDSIELWNYFKKKGVEIYY